MSEMSKKARSEMRDKAKRMTTADPHQKVDASDWTPPEPLNANRKVYDPQTLKGVRPMIYKHGGKIQGDRGPVRKDKLARGGYKRGGYVDGGVPNSRFAEQPIATTSKFVKSGGRIARTGNHKGDGYYEGTRPTGGRIAKEGGGTVSRGGADRSGDFDWREMSRNPDDKARGGRAHRASGGRTKGKGKTNIIINVGSQGPGALPPLPPPAAVTRPPGPPPGPPPGLPPGGPPGGPGGPPIPPASMGGPPPIPGRKRGGMVKMHAGAGSGLGRLEKARRYGERL